MMLLGLTLEDAVNRLANAPYQVRRLENRWLDSGDWRVIKQEEREGVMVLTVTLFRCVELPACREGEPHDEA